MAMNRKSGLYSLLVTAILLAVGIVLPFLTGNVQVLGQAISPLHIPVLICGLTCGWCWGMGLGIVLPLLRSVLFGMPPLVPVAIPMAFEMAAYGALCGLLYPMLSKKMSKTCWAMLIAMVIAMLAGRLVGGAAKAVVMGIQGNAYTFPAFVTGYFVNTAVGAVIHLIVVPLVVTALEKARLSPLGLKAKAAV
jgi:thiamine transporter ThiT